MARTKSFVESEVLDKALNLFWTQGYHATSIQDLVNHLGINRASIYDTWGDKHGLYLETLKQYRRNNSSQLLEKIRSEQSAVEFIRGFLEDIVSDSSADELKKGCYLSNSATELANCDQTVSDMFTDNRVKMEAVLNELIKEGQEAGEFSSKPVSYTHLLWTETLNAINSDSLKLVTSESGVGPSDHTSFYLQDLPVLHFFTGQHEDYHKPSDDADKINYEGMVLMIRFIERLVGELNSEEKLAFTKTNDSSGNNPRFTVWLGLVPEYLFDGQGMRIDGVTDGKPASAAGMKKGDIVVKLGDSTIVDMMSYMRALSGFKAGQQTVVEFKRGEELKAAEVKF